MKRIISLLLLLSIYLSVLASCEFGRTAVDSTAGSADVGNTSAADSDEMDNTPVITEQDRVDIEETVYNYIKNLLADNAFEPENATAVYEGNAFKGILYTDTSTQRLELLGVTDADAQSECGFISIAEKGIPLLDPETDDDWQHIYFTSEETQEACEVAFVTDCVYNTHFVVNDLYVRLEFDLLNARYEILANDFSKYDLFLGEVYDVTRQESLYDPWMEYQPIGATGLDTPYDYDEIQESVDKLISEQTAAGYRVESIYYIYIDPDAVQAFLASTETFESFFDVPVSELFGDQAYIFTPSGYTEGGIIDDQYESAFISTLKNYDWNKFLGKVAIGCGIVIVGAALAPVTGGCSFTMAVGAIVKSAVREAVVETLIGTTVSVIASYAAGDRKNEIVENGVTAFLDSLSNGWVAETFASSVMVNTGKIQACFTAGTLIAMDNGTYVPIESVRAGDMVWATNPDTGETELKEVLQTFKRESDELVHITVGGEEITTTPTHPFWVPQKGWTDAIELRAGDRLQLLNGEYVIIEQVQHELLESPVVVYNIEVDGFHTYHVGENSVLTHNKCKNDYQTKQTSQKSAQFGSEREARNFVRQKVGHNPINAGSGKLRSANGVWQYRAKPGDLAKNHIHLEKLNPKTGEVLVNWHLNW